MENVMSNPTHQSETATSSIADASPPPSVVAAVHHPDRPALVWTGRVLSGLFVVFILGASAAPKLLQMPVAEATMAELGWPAGHAFSIGVLEALCVTLYLVPRTSIFGAVFTMGLLGGAMATQIRAQNPLFSHVLFSVYVGLVMWGGLWLRSPRLRDLPRRSSVSATSKVEVM
jgi:hypothetical protein